VNAILSTLWCAGEIPKSAADLINSLVDNTVTIGVTFQDSRPFTMSSAVEDAFRDSLGITKKYKAGDKMVFLAITGDENDERFYTTPADKPYNLVFESIINYVVGTRLVFSTPELARAVMRWVAYTVAVVTKRAIRIAPRRRELG
jgi:hypothetical protein